MNLFPEKFKNYNLKQSVRTRNAGYTFIELIVVISIFGIMASVAVLNFSDYTTQTTLQNTAEDIALTIKQAQSASIAGKTLGQQGPDFTPSYGIYLSDNAAKSDRFVYFYNSLVGTSPGYESTNGEKIREISITTSDRIEKLCITDANNDEDCGGITNMSIAFRRPFPDAIITTNATGGTVPNGAVIYIISTKGKHLKVTISALGSIAVSPILAS